MQSRIAAELQLAAGRNHITLVDAEAESLRKQNPGEQRRYYQQCDASRRRFYPASEAP